MPFYPGAFPDDVVATHRNDDKAKGHENRADRRWVARGKKVSVYNHGGSSLALIIAVTSSKFQARRRPPNVRVDSPRLRLQLRKNIGEDAALSDRLRKPLPVAVYD